MINLITEGKTILSQFDTKIPQNATNPGLFPCQTAKMMYNSAQRIQKSPTLTND